MRKGNVSSQTTGYSARASNAMGQHRMNKMIHKKKAAMATSFVAEANRSVQSYDQKPPASILYYETARGNVSSTDRKSTRLNSSHSQISYAVFCLKKKKDKH